jgi:hypothetical protein
MNSSIVLTRTAFEAQAEQIVPSAQGMAMCLLLLDRSGSMGVHGDTPRLSANELIDTLSKAPGAEQTLFALLTFGDTVTLDGAPARADRARPLENYVASGNTALYQASRYALALGIAFRDFARRQFGSGARVAISIISDGADTASGDMADAARRLAAVGRGHDFALQAIGLGIDARRLAADLGFTPGLAHTVPNSHIGMKASMRRSSMFFSATMMGMSGNRPASDE